MPVRSERLLIAALTAIHFAHLVDFVIMMPLGPQLISELGLRSDQFSYAIAAYTWAAAASSLAASFVVERFDRRHVLLAAFAGFVLATGACGAAPGYAALLAARAGAGACGGILFACIFAIIGDCIPYERRGAATGLVMSAFSIASVIGIPIGVDLAQRTSLSWRAPFLVLAVVAAVVWIVCAMVVPSLRGHLEHGGAEPAWPRLRRILANPSARWALALSAALNFSGMVVVPFLNPYLVFNDGLEVKDTRWLYLAGGLCTAVSSPLIGRLSDRFGKHRVFMLMAALSFATTLALTNLPAAPFAVVLACMAAYMVTGSGRFVPATALITATVEPAQRGSFMNLNSSVQSLMAGIGSVVAGQIVGQGAGGRIVGFPILGWLSVAAALAAVAVAPWITASPAGRIAADPLPAA